MAKTFDNKDVSYNKGKAYNLSKSQLKKAGASKAAKARTVDISATKRVTTGAMKGKTVGPGGKPLTGSVKLPSGVTAVYRDGKRVTAAAGPKPARRPTTAPRSGGSASTGGGNSGGSGSGGGNKGGNKGGGGKPSSVTPSNYANLPSAPSAPAGVSSSKWASLTAAQKSTFRQNVAKVASTKGVSLAQAAALVVAGKGSVLAKAAGVGGSSSSSSSSSTPARPQSSYPGGARPGTAGYTKPKPKPPSKNTTRRDPRGGGKNAGGR